MPSPPAPATPVAAEPSPERPPVPQKVARVEARPLTDRLAVTYFVRSADPKGDTVVGLVVFMKGQSGWTKRRPVWSAATEPRAVSQFVWPEVTFRVMYEPASGYAMLSGLGTGGVYTESNLVVVDGFGTSSLRVSHQESVVELRAPSDVDPIANFLSRSPKLRQAVDVPLEAVASARPSGADFSGGDGLSCQRRVIITGVTTELSGIKAEHEWLAAKYPGYELQGQSIADCDGHPIDEIQIKTAKGQELEIDFDISAFFGKGLQ